jgi:hypothetical protein
VASRKIHYVAMRTKVNELPSARGGRTKCVTQASARAIRESTYAGMGAPEMGSQSWSPATRRRHYY